MYIIILILIIRFISPIQKEISQENEDTSKIKQYFQVFKNGLQFAFSKPTFICFFIGYAIFNGFMDGVWTKLILFPYFNSYLGTDFYTGLFRWIGLTIDIFLVLLLKKIPTNSKNPKKGYLFSLLGIVGGLTAFMLFYFISPPGGTVTIWSFIKLFLIDFTLAIPYRLTFLFFAKILIDFIPNEVKKFSIFSTPYFNLNNQYPCSIIGWKINRKY